MGIDWLLTGWLGGDQEPKLYPDDDDEAEDEDRIE